MQPFHFLRNSSGVSKCEPGLLETLFLDISGPFGDNLVNDGTDLVQEVLDVRMVRKSHS